MFDVIGTVSLDRITDRCKVLLDAGLVDRYEQEIVEGRFETYWSITTWGRQYLDNEIDSSLDVSLPSSWLPI